MAEFIQLFGQLFQLVATPIGGIIAAIIFLGLGGWLVTPTEKNGVKEEASMAAKAVGGLMIVIGIVIIGGHIWAWKAKQAVNTAVNTAVSSAPSVSYTPVPQSAQSFPPPPPPLPPTISSATPIAKFGRGRRVYRMC